MARKSTVKKMREFQVSHGSFLSYGPKSIHGGVNFAVPSLNATGCVLVLFDSKTLEPIWEFEFTSSYRVGNAYAVFVHDIDSEDFAYGYRFSGPWDPEVGHRFDETKVIVDPCAPFVTGRNVWRADPDWMRSPQYLGMFHPHTRFDWEDTDNPETPLDASIIYELHVRGFTADPSAKVASPGTYAALTEKIPYLKDLGVTAVELLPIFEFDEWDGARPNPETGEQMVNYWGYNTVNFYSPKLGFAAATTSAGVSVELKTMVREFHRNGIEVILDVVFNHTSEGDHRGNTFSFRGIDNKVYYMLTPGGWYNNFSGCGNTFNAEHPFVRTFIIECLRYWVDEYRIDGFRFDLASILTRDQDGSPMAHPPLIDQMTHAPLLSKCKFIAEAWDAGGLYQVGHFPSYGKFGEWNGKFRDCGRRFLKGDRGLSGEMGLRLIGSPDLYTNAESHHGINFLTCHDGFTLRDLVSYNGKHNERNGDNNTDGADDNNSWNCGVEGETKDAEILALRMRQMKNAFALLLLSAGVPMITMGDEVGRTQFGNNNAYCQDSELSWMNWKDVKKYSELRRFVKELIGLRKRYLSLSIATAFGEDSREKYPVVSFHGYQPYQPDYSADSSLVCLMLDPCQFAKGDPVLFIAFNNNFEGAEIVLPQSPDGNDWRVVLNTGVSAPHDIFIEKDQPVLENQTSIWIGARSSIVLSAFSSDATR